MVLGPDVVRRVQGVGVRHKGISVVLLVSAFLVQSLEAFSAEMIQLYLLHAVRLIAENLLYCRAVPCSLDPSESCMSNAKGVLTINSERLSGLAKSTFFLD